MSVIYIVSGRCGVLMDEPKVFYNIKLAEKYIKEIIYDLILTDHDEDEMEGERIDVENVDRVLEWGLKNNYCECNNCSFPDTYTDTDDWSEFMITKVSLPRKEN